MVKLICCRIILTASSPGILLICHSLAIRLLDIPPLSSGRVRSDVSSYTWTLMVALIHWVCFLFFIRELMIFKPPSYSVVFRRLVRLGSFPACWRQANVPRITEGPPFSSYRPISITSVLPRVFERLVSVRVERFMNALVSNHQVCLSQRPGYL